MTLFVAFFMILFFFCSKEELYGTKGNIRKRRRWWRKVDLRLFLLHKRIFTSIFCLFFVKETNLSSFFVLWRFASFTICDKVRDEDAAFIHKATTTTSNAQMKFWLAREKNGMQKWKKCRKIKTMAYQFLLYDMNSMKTMIMNDVADKP